VCHSSPLSQPCAGTHGPAAHASSVSTPPPRSQPCAGTHGPAAHASSVSTAPPVNLVVASQLAGVRTVGTAGPLAMSSTADASSIMISSLRVKEHPSRHVLLPRQCLLESSSSSSSSSSMLPEISHAARGSKASAVLLVAAPPLTYSLLCMYNSFMPFERPYVTHEKEFRDKYEPTHWSDSFGASPNHVIFATDRLLNPSR
jgi:hypothetical protein